MAMVVPEELAMATEASDADGGGAVAAFEARPWARPAASRAAVARVAVGLEAAEGAVTGQSAS